VRIWDFQDCYRETPMADTDANMSPNSALPAAPERPETVDFEAFFAPIPADVLAAVRRATEAALADATPESDVLEALASRLTHAGDFMHCPIPPDERNAPMSQHEPSQTDGLVSLPFYLSRLPQAELQALRRVNLEQHFITAPALGHVLDLNLTSEWTRREKSEAGEPFEPRPVLIEVGLFSDRDLGEALRQVTAFSLGVHEHHVAGELFDLLCRFFADEASKRLSASADPRNAAPFSSRWDAAWAARTGEPNDAMPPL